MINPAEALSKSLEIQLAGPSRVEPEPQLLNSSIPLILRLL
jgi:hypothetical protein